MAKGSVNSSLWCMPCRKWGQIGSSPLLVRCRSMKLQSDWMLLPPTNYKVNCISGYFRRVSADEPAFTLWAVVSSVLITTSGGDALMLPP